MNRTKWLFAGALAAAIVLGVSSPALADDYCARSYSRQNVYADPYGISDPYGDTRPHDSYRGGYSYQGNYDPRYDGSRYGDYPQTQYRNSRPYYDDGYGRQGYDGGTVHEDHSRSTFRLFPFPHVDKRVVHHQHPAY
ncbi:MAG: hypothetical protein M3R62_05130 [Acidobacteriota bacterium]|nr:hypothetical protein [Acidobacteriota bacterium]